MKYYGTKNNKDYGFYEDKFDNAVKSDHFGFRRKLCFKIRMALEDRILRHRKLAFRQTSEFSCVFSRFYALLPEVCEIELRKMQQCFGKLQLVEIVIALYNKPYAVH